MELVVKNLLAKAGGLRHAGLIPGLGRSPGEGNSNPLQYSSLEDPHGQRSLVGYGPEGRKESDRTEVTEHAHALIPKGPSVADSENVTHMTQCTFKTSKETPKGVLRHNA